MVHRRSYATARWLFLRVLGAIYVAAFASAAVQIVGLIGHDGVLPARAYIESARAWAGAQQVGLDRLRLLPTLAWISTSDRFLQGLCVAGVALGSLLAVGVAPALMLPLLWADYLSLSVVSREFLSFQWDALLLEAGLLAIFVAPPRRIDSWRHRADPPRVGVWLLQWLLFRLMLGSGLVKLASGDPTWHSLTAMTYHYETQPLPTPLAWYAHQLPLWFQKASTLATLIIEIAGPWLMLVPRRWARLAACASFVSLQALVALTGNYAFFNWLTASLCVFLLDDETMARVRRTGPSVEQPPRARADVEHRRYRVRVQHAVVVLGAIVLGPVSLFRFTSSVGVRMPGAAVVAPVADFLSPFRSVNAYGLFAVMTTTRPEIVVEGSDDGESWRAYEFKYKPGDVARRPPWVAPHQPRLDWQMWFAALGPYEDAPWFRDVLVRLLQGSPDVLRLLASDPFNGRPPRYVRAVLYQYHYADPAAHARGVWWRRDRLGDFSPTLSADRLQ